MIRRTTLLAGALFLAIASNAAAQCPTVSTTTYGTGCATVFDVPAYKVGFDASSCSITLGFSGLSGCCNTFLTSRIVFLGLQQLNVPAPSVGPGCTLLADPFVIAVLPAGVETVNATVPPLPAGVTVSIYSQYINQYTTFGLSQDYNMSNGVAIKMAG